MPLQGLILSYLEQNRTGLVNLGYEKTRKHQTPLDAARAGRQAHARVRACDGRGESAVKKLEKMDAELGMNDDPTMTNNSRNKSKTAPEVDIQYGEDDGGMTPSDKSAASQKTQTDQTTLMMQMMQQMQQMQKELADLKKPVKKAPKSKIAAD